MSVQKYVSCALALALLILLDACTASTRPGAIGVTRKQLLLVPAQQLEQSAAATFATAARKAQASGALVEGEEYNALREIAGRLIAQVSVYRPDAQKWNWQVALINSKELNAFCLPGGKIVFYTGIIRTLKLTNAEIAAIMGHEMAHALREHGRERLSEQMGTKLLASAAGLLGAPSAGVQLGQAAMTYLVTLPNSRQHETEADQMGLELMARAGYNPEAAINVWRKMQNAEGSGVPQFLSTHPSHATRIQDLQKLMPVVMPLYQQAGGMDQTY